MVDDWMTPREVATYLQISVAMVYDLCANKGLRCSKLGHSTMRIRRSWVDEWVEQHSVKAKAG